MIFRLSVCVVLFALTSCRDPEASCEAGTTFCSASCANLQTDARHCGACGTACASGEACQAGSCVTGCTVGGVFVVEGTVDGCSVCDSSRSTTQFSARADGATCGDALVCHSGTCASGCFISGVFVAANASNPANPCERCEPSRAATAWSTLADGSGCGNGQVCGGGACGSGCFIDGVARATGERNPLNACEHCAPGTSTSAWSTRAVGEACGAGQVCSNGACAAQCFIAGSVVGANGINPDNACEQCVPTQSTTSWSPRADGLACATGQVCAGGACVASCFIDQTLVAAGDVNPSNACESCQPANSTTVWFPRAVGTSCGAGQVCEGSACVAKCFVDGGLYAAAAVNVANGCEICAPAMSTTAFSRRDEVPLLVGGIDPTLQGWNVISQAPFTLSTGPDYVRLATANGTSTSGQLLLRRPTVDAGASFAIRAELMVESVSPHNQLDAAAAILGSFTSPFGNGVDRSQMVYLDSAAVGWADDTQSAPFNNVDGGYHAYELSVDDGGVATFSVDGVPRLTRNNFTSNGVIAIGDQTNDLNVNSALRIRSVSLVCQ